MVFEWSVALSFPARVDIRIVYYFLYIYTLMHYNSTVLALSILAPTHLALL